MTQTISATPDTNPRVQTGVRAGSAQALPTGTRTFDAFLGDAVFREGISERPEAPEEAREVREAEPAAEEDDAVHAEDAEENDAEEVREDPQGSAAETKPVGEEITDAETPVEGEVTDAEIDESLIAVDEDAVDLTVVPEPVSGGGVQVRRAANVSARAVRAELTHAADVDIASINAGELASRGEAKAAESEPAPKARPDANAGNGQAKHDGAPKAPTTPAPAQSTDNTAVSTESAPTKAAGSAANATAASAVVAAGAPGVNQARPAGQPGSGNASGAANNSVIAAAGAAGAQAAASTKTGAPGVVRAVEGTRASGPQVRTAGKGAAPHSRPQTANNAPALATVQKGLASVLKTGGGTISLRLTPDALGEVRVELNVKDGVANARLEATSESARRLLTENLSTLREALEAKGVRVERLSVELRSGTEASPEAARGERPGTDAGRAQQGDSSENGSRGAGSETGAGEDGRAAEDHAARQHAANTGHPRSGGDEPGSEHPADATDEPGLSDADPAWTPDDVAWIGLDTVA